MRIDKLESAEIHGFQAFSDNAIVDPKNSRQISSLNLTLIKNDQSLRRISSSFSEEAVVKPNNLLVRNGLVLRKSNSNFAPNRSGWRIKGAWRGSAGKYQAEVIATKNTSLKELARLITGNEDDWKLLNQPNEVALKGTKIDVSPLLAKMENDIRAGVIAAKDEFKSAFPNTLEELKMAGVNVDGRPVVNSNSADEPAKVRKYFGKDVYGFRDCRTAVQAIYSKAVLDTVGDKAFNRLGYSLDYVPMDFRAVENIKDTKIGDWIRFDNFPDYIEKAGKFAPWQAENVIKIGDDRYWGHGAGDTTGLSEKEWLELLRKKYVTDTKTPDYQVKDLPPGYAKTDVWFIDVAKIASDMFNYRASQIPRKK